AHGILSQKSAPPSAIPACEGPTMGVTWSPVGCGFGRGAPAKRPIPTASAAPPTTKSAVDAVALVHAECMSSIPDCFVHFAPSQNSRALSSFDLARIPRPDPAAI